VIAQVSRGPVEQWGMGSNAQLAEADAVPRFRFSRQPIADVRQRLVGWELRARGEAARHEFSHEAFAELAFEEAGWPGKAFLKVETDALLADAELPFEPEQVALVVRAAEAPSDELVERLHALRDAGFTIVLDDYRDPGDVVPLLDAIDMVRIDVHTLGLAQAVWHAEELAARDVRLLAANVENENQQAACRAAGFDLFQGYWFCAPELTASDQQAEPDAAVVAAAQLVSPDAGLLEIEAAIRMDAGLSVRLLRHLNSAAIALPRRVSSIRMAVLMLGEKRMKQWVMLHALAGVGPQRPALLWAALVRARFCELIGRRDRVADPHGWFACGLLSTTDALTGYPIAEAVANLPLSQDLRVALVEHRGAMGLALHNALMCERGLETKDALLDAHAEAMSWADRIAPDPAE